MKAGAVPWTILRAAQFHEFADQVLAQVPGPIALVPKMQSQPIAVSEVAAHRTTDSRGGGKGHGQRRVAATDPGPRGRQTYAEWLAELTPDSI